MITIQKYIRAESLEEAYQLNQNRQNRIMGGMLWLKMGRGNVNTCIDLCGLGLDTIEETKEHFSIGAMTSLRQIELHPGLNAYTGGAAACAVKDIVGVQFRNLATVGAASGGASASPMCLPFSSAWIPMWNYTKEASSLWKNLHP